jgi:hypothetical protein
MKANFKRVNREGTTVRWSPEQVEAFHARLRDSKRLLDAFPGPLPGPCLLREVPDAGGGDVEAVPLSGCLVVGRQGDAPVAFAADRAMSGRHFRILAGRDGRCYADDLRSRNGLWVNGRRVEYRFLVHGDFIHAGSQDFVFHDGQGPDAERPPWLE